MTTQTILLLDRTALYRDFLKTEIEDELEAQVIPFNSILGIENFLAQNQKEVSIVTGFILDPPKGTKTAAKALSTLYTDSCDFIAKAIVLKKVRSIALYTSESFWENKRLYALLPKTAKHHRKFGFFEKGSGEELRKMMDFLKGIANVRSQYKKRLT